RAPRILGKPRATLLEGVDTRVPNADFLPAPCWYQPQTDFGVDSIQIRNRHEVHLLVLRAINAEGVDLTVVRHSIWPTGICAPRPKPDHATVAFECSSLALDARKRAVEIVDDDVIPQAITDWPEDRF